jgi:fucose permease
MSGGTVPVGDPAEIPLAVRPAAVGAAAPGRGSVRRARLAVGAIFVLHGATTGSYASRLPWLENHLHATPGVLGAVMIAQGAGALLASPATGAIGRRLSPQARMRMLALAWTGSLALPALMPDVWALAAVLFGFGAAAGCLDVAMNSLAVQVERRAGRSIMSGLHGLWSVGVIVGSVAGGVSADVGIGAPVQFLVTAAVLSALAIPVCGMVPVDGPEDAAAGPPRYALPTRPLLVIGVVAFCAVFAEGASDNWCAVYLTRVEHTTAATGAYCLTAFSIAMAAGRLSGDAAVRRFGAAATVRAGGVLTLLGAVLVVAAHGPGPAFAGFAAVGLGIATVVPLAIAASGRTGTDPAASVAGMTTIVYGGSLMAGPVVGGLGSAVSLPFGFSTLVLGAAGIVLGSRAVGAR